MNTPLNGTAGQFELVAWDFHSWKQLATISLPQAWSIFPGTPAYSAVSYEQEVFLCLHDQQSNGAAGMVVQLDMSDPYTPHVSANVPWTSSNTAAAPVAAASSQFIIFASSQQSQPAQSSVLIAIYKYT